MVIDVPGVQVSCDWSADGSSTQYSPLIGPDRALLRPHAERHHRPRAREGRVPGEGARHAQALGAVVQGRHGGVRQRPAGHQGDYRPGVAAADCVLQLEEDGGSVAVRDVRLSDCGTIKCVATNILGRATSVAQLSIEGNQAPSPRTSKHFIHHFRV